MNPASSRFQLTYLPRPSEAARFGGIYVGAPLMLILTTAQATRHAMDRYSAHVPITILERYSAMLEAEPIAWLFILQPGDSAEFLEQVRGQPFASWEYIDRVGGWFEAVFIISDNGYGHVVLLRDQPDSDPELLTTCRTFATIAE